MKRTLTLEGTITVMLGLFHKTFFFVIYGHFAINYRIFAIYEQIYGQNLDVTTNP